MIVDFEIDRGYEKCHRKRKLESLKYLISTFNLKAHENQWLGVIGAPAKRGKVYHQWV
jgi:hypothetical protein